MSARDSSAIRYVATLIHRKNGVRCCLCERCSALAHVVKLAESHVSLKRLSRRNTAPKARRSTLNAQENNRGER